MRENPAGVSEEKMRELEASLETDSLLASSSSLWAYWYHQRSRALQKKKIEQQSPTYKTSPSDSR